MHKKTQTKKDNKMKKLILTVLATTALALLANAAPVPTTATYPPPGDVLVASKTIAFGPAGAPTISGTLLSEVWRDPDGTLDFIYRITNNAASADVLQRLTIGGFKAFTTVLTQTVGGGTVIAADNGTKSAAGTVGFDFGNLGGSPISPGDTSTYLFIDTNATAFRTRDAGVSDNVTFNVSSFAPVPDGGSAVALLGIALAGIEGLRRKIGARKA